MYHGLLPPSSDGAASHKHLLSRRACRSMLHAIQPDVRLHELVLPEVAHLDHEVDLANGRERPSGRLRGSRTRPRSFLFVLGALRSHRPPVDNAGSEQLNSDLRRTASGIPSARVGAARRMGTQSDTPHSALVGPPGIEEATPSGRPPYRYNAALTCETQERRKRRSATASHPPPHCTTSPPGSYSPRPAHAILARVEHTDLLCVVPHLRDDPPRLRECAKRL